MSKLSNAEKKEFLENLNIYESNLSLLAKQTCKLLNLSSFFTCGVDETKA
jgi:ribosome-binding ATPase YchF (GTP1/OBG family)